MITPSVVHSGRVVGVAGAGVEAASSTRMPATVCTHAGFVAGPRGEGVGQHASLRETISTGHGRLDRRAHEVH